LKIEHKITCDDLKNYEFDHQVAGSFGKDVHKELKIVVKGMDVHYEVWSYRMIIVSTKNQLEAVGAYNSI
jgi:hypothetical protein